MPWKSRAQMRKFYLMRERGEITDDEFNEWKAATTNINALPERIHDRRRRRRRRGD